MRGLGFGLGLAFLKMKRISIQEIKDRLFAVHGDTVTMDEATYQGTYKSARFIDCEFGEFWNTVKNVLRGQGHKSKARAKLEATNLDKYGVSWAGQDPNVKIKIRDSNMEHFGVPVSSQSEEVKQRTKENNLKKYGVGCTFQMPGVKEKMLL